MINEPLYSGSSGGSTLKRCPGGWQEVEPADLQMLQFGTLCSLPEQPLFSPAAAISLHHLLHLHLALPGEVCPLVSETVCMETHHQPHGGSTATEGVCNSEYVGASCVSSSRTAGLRLSWVPESRSPGLSGRGWTSALCGKVNVAGAWPIHGDTGCQVGCLPFSSRNRRRGCCQPRLLRREAETDGVLRGADKKWASCQIEHD